MQIVHIRAVSISRTIYLLNLPRRPFPWSDHAENGLQSRYTANLYSLLLASVFHWKAAEMLLFCPNCQVLVLPYLELEPTLWPDVWLIDRLIRRTDDDDDYESILKLMFYVNDVSRESYVRHQLSIFANMLPILSRHSKSGIRL